jgi:restriction system protein
VQYDFGPFFLKSLLQGVWQAFGMLFSTWYTWAFLLLLMAMKYGPGLIESRQLRKAGMPEIDRMSGLEFEKYLEILFGRLGYHVQRTAYVGDQGGDLVLTKGGEKILVQAKRHSKAIGNKAVQEAAAARPHYQCHRAMVVANQEFTRPARELAKSNQVELWGRRKLAEVVLSLQSQAVAPQPTPIAAARAATPVRPAAQSAATAPARSTAPHRAAVPSAGPTCQRCGKPMVLRDSARGKFWGCAGFPKCRNIVPYVGA